LSDQKGRRKWSRDLLDLAEQRSTWRKNVVLRVALRIRKGRSVNVDGKNVGPELRCVLDKVQWKAPFAVVTAAMERS
jgi:hypothetical protein